MMPTALTLPTSDRYLLIEETDEYDVSDIVTVLIEDTSWSLNRFLLGIEGGYA